MSLTSFSFTEYGVRTVLATSFFVSGYFAKKHLQHVPLWAGVASFAVVLLFAMTISRSYTIGGVKGCEVPLFYCLAILGIIGVFCVSARLKGIVARFFDYAGKETLMILTFHFLVFKLISIIKCYAYGLPIDAISEFPIIHGHNSWFWLAYVAAGIGVPLLICKGIDSLKSKLVSNKSAK